MCRGTDIRAWKVLKLHGLFAAAFMIVNLGVYEQINGDLKFNYIRGCYLSIKRTKFSPVQ